MELFVGKLILLKVFFIVLLCFVMLYVQSFYISLGQFFFSDIIHFTKLYQEMVSIEFYL